MKGAFTKHYDGGVHVWSAALLQCIEILGNQSSYTFQLLIYNKPFVFSENIYHNRGYGGNTVSPEPKLRFLSWKLLKYALHF